MPSQSVADAPHADALRSDAPDAMGLVAYYSMDSLGSDSACVIADVSGNGHDGTCITTNLAIAPGEIGSGLAFTQVQPRTAGIGGGFIVNTTGDLVTMDDMTVAAWINPVASLVRGCVLNRTLEATPNDVWQLCVDFESQAGSNNLLALDSTGEGLTIPIPSPGWGSAWHHVALTWSGSDTLETVYIDGLVQGTRTVDMPFSADDVLTFGRDLDPEPVAPFTGTLDELRLYNRVLSNDEVMQLAQPQ